LAAEGDTVEVDADFFTLDTEGKPNSGAAPVEKAEPAAEAPKAADSAPTPNQATPAKEAPKAAAPAKKAKSPAGAAPTKIHGARSETRVKMTRMRQRIATRLKDAQNTAALLTTFNEVDMTNIMALRKKYQDQFIAKHGIKLGFMSAFIKASTQALKEQPVVNAYIEGDEIIYHDFVDVSVAVSTPTGLVVPVLRNVENMGYADIEKGLTNLALKARDGKITLEDMAGGTFTVSNGGVFGSMLGTPILNPPQSAILGMHGTKSRAVVVDGKVEARPMMYLALTYDHRLIDGREAVMFLRKIVSGIENPETILLDL
jgi:2-oxoglutarate dehydrogenase E2 component (dihydrolipoamide succinyltransferase)